jgi:hypothetical protein
MNMSKTSGSAAIRPVASGPVFTCNDPAKFSGKGKSSGKTPANGVETRVPGPTLTVNSTHIPTMNADKPAPLSKAKSHGKGEDPHQSGTAKNASDKGTSGGQNSYGLKSSYGK